jgi:hypothetical protein
MRLWLLLTLCAGNVWAADGTAKAHAWAGAAYDSNAARNFVSPGDRPRGDGFLFALLDLQGALFFGTTVSIAGNYNIAGRKFIFGPSEDMLLQAASIEVNVQVTKVFSLGPIGSFRDRRGAERDYTDLQGGAFVSFAPSASVDVRITGLAHRFIFYNRFAYSWWGPDVALSARYRFNRQHSIALSAFFNPRTYNSSRNLPPDETSEVELRRADSFLGASVSYAFRGPFQLSGGYSYFDQTSNSYGESIRRHRLTVSAGIRLPFQLVALATGTLQLSQFPDGIFLSPELAVASDDENSSAFTLKLSRALSKVVELDIRYSAYFNQFPGAQYLYSRHVVSLGAAVDF